MSAPVNGSGRRIAVIGAGMAAARFAERYRALGGTGQVTLYGAEPRAPYNRVLLADVLTGRYDAEAVALPVGGARLCLGGEVVAVDLDARKLTLADGSVEAWDDLVFATGANPVLPPIRGLRSPDGTGLREGVHALRSLADCVRLAEAAATAERAVVVGGGVLGVSVARALAALGLSVEIVHQGPHLIERQLDAEAAEVLRGRLRSLGVETYPRNRARALIAYSTYSTYSADSVRSADGAGGADGAERDGHAAVELANGYRLGTDLTVLACGVRPRTGLAHATGLDVGAGIVVDDTLTARVGGAARPGVHAVGDCAEHRGVVHGLSGPAWQQADVLAARLSGADPEAVYTGSRPLARLTAGPLEFAAFGESHTDGDSYPADGAHADQGDHHLLRITDATRGSYKKLVLRGDRLVGGILVGDLATVGALTRAYERDEALTDTPPLHLLTTYGAS